MEDLWHLFLKTGVGITHIKDHMNFFPGDSPYTKLSLAFDAGLSVSLSRQIKLMVGSTLRAVNTDNLDGVHVAATYLNGNSVSYMKVYEVYNFTYFRVSYSMGDFGSQKSKSSFNKKRGRSSSYRRK